MPRAPRLALSIAPRNQRSALRGDRARPTKGGAGIGALAIAVVGFVLTGCPGGAQSPEPTKLSQDPSPVDPPRQAPKKDGPFRNPATDPPEPRGGAQLADPELEAALAEAKTLAQAGDYNRAMLALRTCANKIPASARCDGEIGIAMLELRSRKAHGVYFIDEAAKTDDPKADAAFYRRIADYARRFGRHATAASAMSKVIAREPESAEDWIGLSRALQADEARVEEAIQALDEALTRAPDRADLRFERAVLLAQTPDLERAIAGFEDFLAKAPEGDKNIALAKDRITLLRGQLAQDGAKPARDEKGGAAQ